MMGASFRKGQTPRWSRLAGAMACWLAAALSVGNGAMPVKAQTPQPSTQPTLSPIQPTSSAPATRTPSAVTPIALPSATPMPSPTPAPTLPGDALEPNNSPAEVLAQNPVRSFISSGQVLNGLNFNNGAGLGAAGDVDWIQMYVKGGATYQLTTLVQPGVDTEVFIYRDADEATLLTSNDDYRALDRGSQAQFTAQADGRYWVKIWNKDQSPRAASQQYAVELKEVLLTTPTPLASATVAPSNTPLPSASPLPTQKPFNSNGADKFEYNGDIGSAVAIELNKSYDFLNFAPLNPSAPSVVDNDFFKLSVAKGSTFSCHTFNLGGGADTVMAVYDQGLAELGRNDDVSAEERANGNLGSRVTWQAKADGIAYIMVYDAYPLPAADAATHSYTLQCYFGSKPPENAAKPTATIAPPPTVPRDVAPPLPPTKAPLGATFVPPTPDLPPPPNATAAVAAILQSAPMVVPVRPLPRSLPTLVPPTGIPMRTVALTLQIFSDVNANGVAEPIEGVAGVSVRVLADQNGELLDQGLTDREGNVRFLALSPSAVRVSVPLLDYVTLVTGDNAHVRIVYQSQPFLPERLP